MSVTEILNMYDVSHGTFSARARRMKRIAGMCWKFNGSGKAGEEASGDLASSDTPKCGRLPKYRHRDR